MNRQSAVAFIDRLVLGLAVTAPADSAALDLAYAEVMVEIFNEWFALRG